MQNHKSVTQVEELGRVLSSREGGDVTFHDYVLGDFGHVLLGDDEPCD